MYFEIVSYNDMGVRSVMITEEGSIKRVSHLFNIYRELLSKGLLHPKIDRIKCYIVDYEKIINITDCISDGYNVYRKVSEWENIVEKVNE